MIIKLETEDIKKYGYSTGCRLAYIRTNPTASKRKMAYDFGINLGSAGKVLRALERQGLIKVEREAPIEGYKKPIVVRMDVC